MSHDMRNPNNVSVRRRHERTQSVFFVRMNKACRGVPTCTQNACAYNSEPPV